MINVVFFGRIALKYWVFSFCILSSLYSCGSANEVSEKSDDKDNLDGYSNIVEKEETKIVRTSVPQDADRNIDPGDINKGLGNKIVEVLKPTPINIDSDGTIDLLDECKDYGINEGKHDKGYYQIHVVEIVSGGVVKGYCESIPIVINYIGITPPEEGSELFDKATALNRFLVFNKNVMLRVDQMDSEGGIIHLLGEIFVDGESVNIRLLSTGLMSLALLDKNFDRIKEFTQASEKATGYHGRERVDRVNESDIPPVGCGTLPCRP